MTLRAESCWFRGVGGALLSFDVRDAGDDARGTCVIVHGLGEHGGKYAEWFEAAVARGYHIAAYDQRGHGRTPGRRGDYVFDDLVGDLERFLGVARDRYPDLPLFVVAHSLGALVALRLAGSLEGVEDGIRGVVLSSPPIALADGRPGWARWGIRLLSRIAPGLPLPRGSDPTRLTRDPDRIEAILGDPNYHRVMTPRAMVSTEEAMLALRRDPPRIPVPALVLVAEEDRVADPAATMAWARELEGDDVTLERIPGGYHEILNDLGRETAYLRILHWCDARSG